MQATYSMNRARNVSSGSQPLLLSEYVSRYLPVLLVVVPLGFNALVVSAITPADIGNSLGRQVQAERSSSPNQVTITSDGNSAGLSHSSREEYM